jgi:predicted transcriptional regulator
MIEVSELETRRRIYDLIVKNPGLHLSKISELLNMRISLVEYHVIFLERNKIISSVKETGFVRYYIAGESGIKDKKILSLLRREIPLKIVLILLKFPYTKHKDLLKYFDIAPSTLSYHLKNLVKHEILSVHPSGDDKGYAVINGEEITNFLIRYKPYDVFDSFTDIWTDFKVE